MIKTRKIGSEAPDWNRNQGPLEVSLRPERGVVGSETPHRARGVWRPRWLAFQTERRGTRKNVGENPEGKAGGCRYRVAALTRQADSTAT